jgi:hypothetical protein
LRTITFPLAQLLAQSGGHDIKFVVIIARPGGNEHLQPALDRQTRRDDEYVFRESVVLRIRDFVQHLPRNQHGHDDCFTAACGHLAAKPPRSAAGPSVSQTSVSIASSWQKKNRFLS